MWEKVKKFAATTAGKIVIGVFAAVLFACILGGGCYIKGCIEGKQQAKEESR